MTKFNSILNRYILGEMIPPFLVSVMFFTFTFLLTMILDITNMIVNYKLGLSEVLRMLLYSMPYFLVFVIPISVMITILLTFLRLSGDNEIIALKAGGVSIYSLLPPVFMFCLMGCVLTWGMNVYGLPWGVLSMRQLTIEVAKSNIDIGLKERTFNDSFKDIMLYVNKIDMRNKILRDVFIEDQRTRNLVITIISPKGQLFSEPEKAIFHLKLSDGTVNQVNLEKKTVNTVRFDTYEVRLDLQKALSNSKNEAKDETEMTLSELWDYLEKDTAKDSQYYVTLMEFHKKFSISFACFVLGLLAIPLGVQSKSAKRSFGLGLGLISFLFYYLMLSAGTVFGEAGKYPPMIGMWVPNIVTGGLGFYLLTRIANDRPLQIHFAGDMTRGMIRWLKSRFAR